MNDVHPAVRVGGPILGFILVYIVVNTMIGQFQTDLEQMRATPAVVEPADPAETDTGEETSESTPEDTDATPDATASNGEGEDGVPGEAAEDASGDSGEESSQ